MPCLGPPTAGERLLAFARRGRVPNLLLHGPSGSGKSTALAALLGAIYGEDEDALAELVMRVDCAQARGIAFVREDLKHFARAQLGCSGNGTMFRCVVIRNADMLTHDTQSALRRCIEVHSRSTRFFLLACDPSKLLRPVLSRFCSVHFPGSPTRNSHVRAVDATLPAPPDDPGRRASLSRIVAGALARKTPPLRLAERLYANGYCGNDVAALSAIQKLDIRLKLDIDRARRTIRDERLLLAFILSKMSSSRGKYVRDAPQIS